MSVSIHNSPALLGATRSPMDLEVSGSNFRTASPAKAVITIHFNNSSNPGDTIELLMPAGSVLFTCADPPDESGEQFASGAGVSLAALGFMQGATSNDFLALNYDITQAGPTVVLTGKVPGAQWGLTTGTPTPGGLATITGAAAGAAATYNSNFNIIVRPRIYTDDEWKVIGSFPLTPDKSTLHATMELQDLLYPYVDKPDWPPFTNTYGAYKHTKSFKPYLVELFERYGDPVESYTIRRLGSVAEPLWAWLAGWERPEAYTWSTFLTRVVGTTPPHPFLTWRNRSAKRYVTKREVHYLGWYHWPMEATPVEFQLQACLTHTEANGTDPVTTAWADQYSADTTDTIPRGAIASFAVGYGQLGLYTDLPTGRIAQKYSVRINETETGPKSEEMTFWIEKENYNERYLWYINSLGCMESLRTTGAWSRPEEHSYLELRRPHAIADNSDTAAGTRTAFPLGAQRQLKVFSGYNPLKEHQAIMDILGSPQVREAAYNSLFVLLPLRFQEGSGVERDKRGLNGELLHGMDLVLAADDPTALTTLNIPAAHFTENEDDGGTSEPGGGGGGGGGP